MNGKALSNTKDKIMVSDIGIKNNDTLLCMIRSNGGQFN